jgi:ABC-type proline/glycine betaine transport system ATPase subunit
MCAGEVRQIATPHELLASPADDYVARLVGVVREQSAKLQALAEPGADAKARTS